MKWFALVSGLLLAACIGDEPLLSEARQTCRDRGIAVGTSAYAACVKATQDALLAYWQEHGSSAGN